jgi:hypothetical protein
VWVGWGGGVVGSGQTLNTKPILGRMGNLAGIMMFAKFKFIN